MIGSSCTQPAVGRALTLVDCWCGVVRQIVVHEIGPADPPLFFATAQLGSTRAFSDVEAGTLNGGAGFDPAAAVMSALGEAVERYGIGLYREADLVRGSFAELGGAAVDPRRLLFFSDEQYDWQDFPYARFDPQLPLSWVPGVSLVDGTSRLVPAVRVFTPYLAPGRRELLMQSTSTGAACHEDRERALLSALHECIERDAFFIAWLNRLPLPEPPPVEIVDAELSVVMGRLRQRGITARWFDATSDLGCPTAVCVLEGSGEEVPAQAFGAATRPTLREAARKALLESAHTWFWIRTRLLKGRKIPSPARFDDVASLDAHSLLYADPRMREHTSFMRGEVPEAVCRWKARVHAACPDPLDTPRQELDCCVGRLAAAGMDVVAIDLTPPEIGDLGFEVVRVVVTDLHPLWGGHHVRCLGGARVRNVPKTLGYPEREPSRADLNDVPHPMP